MKADVIFAGSLITPPLINSAHCVQMSSAAPPSANFSAARRRTGRYWRCAWHLRDLRCGAPAPVRMHVDRFVRSRLRQTFLARNAPRPTSACLVAAPPCCNARAGQQLPPIRVAPLAAIGSNQFQQLRRLRTVRAITGR